MTLPRFAALVPFGLALWAGLAVDGLGAGRRRGLALRLLGPGLVAAAAASAACWSLPAADLALVGLGLALALAAALAPAGGWVAFALAVETACLGFGVNPTAAPADRLPAPPWSSGSKPPSGPRRGGSSASAAPCRRISRAATASPTCARSTRCGRCRLPASWPASASRNRCSAGS